MRPGSMPLAMVAALLSQPLWAGPPMGKSARYSCDADVVLPEGTAKIQQGRTEDGAMLYQSIMWLPDSDGARKAGMRIQWQARSPAPLEWDKGFVAFDRTADTTSSSFMLRKKVVMELRVSPQSYLKSGASFRNPEDVTYGGHMVADLEDVAAMARGSGVLHLISRDKSQKVVESVEIESSNFVIPTSEFEERISEMNQDARPLDDRCADLSVIVI